MRATSLGAMALFSTACNCPENPSFPLTPGDARTALRTMAADPLTQKRPLVIVGGMGDIGVGTWGLKSDLSRNFIEPKVITVNLNGMDTVEEAAQKIVTKVEEAWPSPDPNETIEVDVVALSLGGLASHTATELKAPKRLKAARLYSIAAPLTGAVAATYPTWDSLLLEMRPGSDFIRSLHMSASERRYELVPYTRSDDEIVGPEHTAPEGEIPFWVPSRFLNNGHLSVFADPRILADISRRLRGETPFTREPRTPLPTE